MNTRIEKTFFIFVVACIIQIIYMCIKNECEMSTLLKKTDVLSSYVIYSVEMIKDISMGSINSTVFPGKNILIYCFSEDMCDECIYQDLAELYKIQEDIRKDKILLLPVYRTTRTNQIILRNKFSNFRYMNVSTDSIKFPFHRENGTEQRFFAFIDEFGRLNSFFFPKKNMQDMTRIYLSGVKSKMEYFDKN